MAYNLKNESEVRSTQDLCIHRINVYIVDWSKQLSWLFTLINYTVVLYMYKLFHSFIFDNTGNNVIRIHYTSYYYVYICTNGIYGDSWDIRH